MPEWPYVFGGRARAERDAVRQQLARTQRKIKKLQAVSKRNHADLAQLKEQVEDMQATIVLLHANDHDSNDGHDGHAGHDR